jgi:hypothetical protein
MILPASFTYTRASQGLRERLSSSSRRVRVQRTRAADRPFIGRPVQAAIVLVGPTDDEQRDAHSRGEIATPPAMRLEEWRDTESMSATARGTRSRGDGEGTTVDLAQVAKVQRGVATGAKDMFFLTDTVASELPREVIAPAVLTLRGFNEPELDADRHRAWGNENTRRWLLAIPSAFDVTGRLSEYIREFEDEVSKRFLVSQRDPWYALRGLVRPELLVAPLSKTAFKVVVNSARAVPSNNLMAITTNGRLDAKRLADWMRTPTGQAELQRVSRGYPGGSRKLEPGDLRKLQVPTALYDADN